MKINTSKIAVFIIISILLVGCSRSTSDIHESIMYKNLPIARAFMDNTPGPRLEVKRTPPEVYKKIEPSYEGNQVYHIEAHGFTPGSHYYCYRLNMNYAINYLGVYTVNTEGDLISQENGVLLSKTFFFCDTHMNGEQMYYVFIPVDGETCITAIITPDPIEHQWNDGAYASVALLQFKEWVFYIAGKGFQPYEAIELISKQNNVYSKVLVKANFEGNVLYIFPPLPLGKAEQTSLIVRRNHTEPVVLSYLYGKAAISKSLPKKYPTPDSVPDKALKKEHPPVTIFKVIKNNETNNKE